MVRAMAGVDCGRGGGRRLRGDARSPARAADGRRGRSRQARPLRKADGDGRARECDRMIEACRANGVRLGVAYYRHFYPVVARVKSLIASGAIGDAVLAQINAFEWFNPREGDARSWLTNRAQAGGGPMFDFGCHRLEVLVHVFGPVRRAEGMIANVVFDRDVEDTAAALLHFEGGCCAT